MGIFNGGMKNLWKNRAFVDLLAGPGRCILKHSGEEFDGSPVRALKCDPPFTTVVLVESDPALFAALEARTAIYAPRVQLVAGDCNDPATIATIRKQIPFRALTLAFADMLGLDVTFESVRRLTSGRRIDLAITFQVSDLVRNVPQVLAGNADGARLDRFFGTGDWRRVVAAAEGGALPTPAIGDALTDFYIQRLATLGYLHVAPLHRLMKNTANAPLYRVVLASKHATGADFFKKIAKYEYSGQRGLFG